MKKFDATCYNNIYVRNNKNKLFVKILLISTMKGKNILRFQISALILWKRYRETIPAQIMKNYNTEILQSYSPLPNEVLVCIEDFTAYSFRVYAVYVNGEYDRRIKITK